MMTMTTSSNIVQIKDPRYEKPIQYFLEPWVRKRFDERILPSLKSQDKDYIIAVDGGEGGGKSTLAMQLGKYIDPTLTVDRVVFTPEEFREAIYRAHKGQCIIYDEAFTGFSSRAGLSGVNRTLISLMMQMRQKNLFVIIVLPTIFLLDKYVSLFRTKVLFHVYENHGRRGFFRVYSKKLKTKLIMDKNAKTYSYHVRSKKKGRFYGVFALGDEEEKEKYKNKKLKALEDSEKTPMTAQTIRNREQRDILIYLMRKVTSKSTRQLEEFFKEHKLDISHNQIALICKKLGETDEERDIIEEKSSKFIQEDRELEQLKFNSMEDKAVDEETDDSDDF